jgi:hypothetical protein
LKVVRTLSVDRQALKKDSRLLRGFHRGKAARLCASSVEVKNEWICTLTTPIHLHAQG